MKFNCIFQCLISSYLFFSSELYSLSEVQIISSAFLVHLFKLERLDSNDTSGMDSCTLDSKITRLSAHVDNPHHHHCHHHHHHHAKHHHHDHHYHKPHHCVWEMRRIRSLHVAWVRRVGLLLCWRRQLPQQPDLVEKPIFGNDCETKRKVKRRQKGGAGDWTGFRSPQQDV